MDSMGLVEYSDSGESVEDVSCANKDAVKESKSATGSASQTGLVVQADYNGSFTEKAKVAESAIPINKSFNVDEPTKHEQMIKFLLSSCSEEAKGTEDAHNQSIDPKLEAKFQHFHELKKQGVHFNEQLVRNKNFNNPNIYHKLLEHLDLREIGSNIIYTKQNLKFDPSKFPDSMYYDKLEQARIREAEAKSKAHTANVEAGNRKAIEFVSSGSKQQQHVQDPVQSSVGGFSTIDPSEALKRASQVASMISKTSSSKPKRGRWDQVGN